MSAYAYAVARRNGVPSAWIEDCVKEIEDHAILNALPIKACAKRIAIDYARRFGVTRAGVDRNSYEPPEANGYIDPGFEFAEIMADLARVKLTNGQRIALGKRLRSEALTEAERKQLSNARKSIRAAFA